VLHVVMRQHVYCLGYVSFVLVMYSLPGLVLYLNNTHVLFRLYSLPDLVLYRTRPGKEYITNTNET